MKTKLLLAAAALLASLPAALAQLLIPSDGSDSAFNPASSIQIDLSQAVTGTWSDNNTANAGKGIYDQAKWAVVFKYSSVNIPAGVTVTFKNNISHAPVVWLVSGGVTIAGTVNLNGQNVAVGNNSIPTEPGPGGFRGGGAGVSGNGAGLGFGGTNAIQSNSAASSASYASSYGNPSIIPLIGGSGQGSSANISGPGGGGGGAILIAAPNNISFTSPGAITANGGSGSAGGYGSGGAIRLIANSIVGTGSLQAIAPSGVNPATDGRIRIESNSFPATVVPQPQAFALPPANPPVIWPASNAPSVKIVSVSAIAAPTYPTGSLDTVTDVAISVNAPTQVILQTQNFPTTGTVQVRAASKFTAGVNTPTFTTATLQSGDANSALWTATIPFTTGFTTLQARATVP